MNGNSVPRREGGVRQVTVGPDRSGQRLDNFLMNELGRVPRSLVYRLIRTGQVRVNGGRARPMLKLQAGDQVRVPPVQDERSEPARLPEGLEDQVRAAIVHEQAEFVVLDKPAGLAVQRGSGLHFSLSDVMARIDGELVPAHRLDRWTSGLIVFARGRRAARSLQQCFRRSEVEKRYLALLDGRLPEDLVEVDAPLKKIRDGSGQSRVIVAEDGDPAHSRFRLLEHLGPRSFCEVSISTGRTHQIRVHAAHLGTPLAGDDRYNPAGDAAGVGRLFLHAHVLRLPWPDDQLFSAPLPEDLNRALDRLRRNGNEPARR